MVEVECASRVHIKDLTTPNLVPQENFHHSFAVVDSSSEYRASKFDTYSMTLPRTPHW